MALPQSKFMDFVLRGDDPFMYERNVVCGHWDKVKAIITGENTAPYEWEIQPVAACNLKCRHCIGQAHRPERPVKISPSQMADIVGDIIKGGGTERIKFSGYYGEPLMNKDATLVGMRMAMRNGVKVGLFTNGVLLDTNVMKILMDAEYVNISLDAGSYKSYENLKGSDCFGIVLSNIKMLDGMRKKSKSSLEITVGYILNRENYREIPQIVELLKDHVDMIRFKANILNSDMRPEELDDAYKIIKEAKKYESGHFRIVRIHSRLDAERARKPTFGRCYFLDLMGCIGCDGKPYPCDHKTYFGGDREDLVPKRDCELCPPMGFRINQFLEFLEDEYKRDPKFLDWVEIMVEILCQK